jgi:hypothetical protein
MEEIAMTVSPTLQKYLDQSVTYDLIPHAPTLSSTRTAEACHVPGEALAKAVGAAPRRRLHDGRSSGLPSPASCRP